MKSRSSSFLYKAKRYFSASLDSAKRDTGTATSPWANTNMEASSLPEQRWREASFPFCTFSLWLAGKGHRPLTSLCLCSIGGRAPSFPGHCCCSVGLQCAWWGSLWDVNTVTSPGRVLIVSLSLKSAYHWCLLWKVTSLFSTSSLWWKHWCQHQCVVCSHTVFYCSCSEAQVGTAKDICSDIFNIWGWSLPWKIWHQPTLASTNQIQQQRPGNNIIHVLWRNHRGISCMETIMINWRVFKDLKQGTHAKSWRNVASGVLQRWQMAVFNKNSVWLWKLHGLGWPHFIASMWFCTFVFMSWLCRL